MFRQSAVQIGQLLPFYQWVNESDAPLITARHHPVGARHPPMQAEVEKAQHATRDTQLSSAPFKGFWR
jgi:hypothetical protein